MNKLCAFVLAVIQVIAAFIICYAIKLAVLHDPKVNGLDLFTMGTIAVVCFSLGLTLAVTACLTAVDPVLED